MSRKVECRVGGRRSGCWSLAGLSQVGKQFSVRVYQNKDLFYAQYTTMRQRHDSKMQGKQNIAKENCQQVWQPKAEKPDAIATPTHSSLIVKHNALL